MKTLLSLIITTLVLDASITRAAPVEATNSLSKSASSEPNTKLELFDRDSNAKKNGYFYPCIQPHFLHCKKYWWSAGECHKLPESRQAVGSAASNSGAYCTLYSGDNCDGDVNLPIKSPAEQIGAFHWHSWKCDCNVLRICPVAIDCDLNPKICTDAPEVDLGAEGVMALEEQHTKRDDVLPFISDDSAELIQRDDAITSKIEICSESNHRRCKIITFQTGECNTDIPSFAGTVKSVRIYYENFYCVFFSTDDCGGEVGDIVQYPGDKYFDRSGKKSWKCNCIHGEVCTSLKRYVREDKRDSVYPMPKFKSDEASVELSPMKRDVEERSSESVSSIPPAPTVESPEPTNETQLDGAAKTPDGYFAMCPASLWGGGCSLYAWKTMECYPVPNMFTPWVQSASPTQQSYGNCRLFRDEGCRGEKTPIIVYPGIANFETSGLYGPWKSWTCWCGLKFCGASPS